MDKQGGRRKCCVHECESTQTKDSGLTFHGFPLNDPELCKRWVIATRWENFSPTNNHFICRNHFTPDDFLFSTSKKPKPGAVPSVFKFCNKCPGSKRKAPTPRISEVIPEKKPKLVPAVKRNSPTKEELKKKIKVLQQKVRRKDKKIESLKSMLDDLVNKNLLSEDISANLEKSFSGLPLGFIRNLHHNQD